MRGAPYIERDRGNSLKILAGKLTPGYSSAVFSRVCMLIMFRGRVICVRFIVLLATVLFAAGAAAQSKTQTSERHLANGLRIIVKEDHRAPTVVSMVWYKAGSVDEVNGKTGVAHVLEHMMFKGTETVPAEQFSKIIANVGGRVNAFTARDATGYHEQLHKSQLPLAFRLEADRMANLKLSRDEFDKEIKVVMEERR